MSPARAANLDGVFAALADPTRRAIIERLAGRPAAVGELAQDTTMSLPGFMKHLAILERAGLLARRKDGRVVQCALAPHALREAANWLERYRRFWEERLDALERFLNRQEDRPWPKAPSKRSPRSPSNARTASRRSGSGKRGPKRKR
ncbi:MAG: metalloregulator ArsR/SmtB family transcription factor [Betaproteobacteria bacterium]|jgi:DNA-binding transcriptional ArsR family regulator|nr:metalloregulator ArsR/SmtB family transcription factor [Betaproteobacteria bacterium]